MSDSIESLLALDRYVARDVRGGKVMNTTPATEFLHAHAKNIKADGDIVTLATEGLAKLHKDFWGVNYNVMFYQDIVMDLCKSCSNEGAKVEGVGTVITTHGFSDRRFKELLELDATILNKMYKGVTIACHMIKNDPSAAGVLINHIDNIDFTNANGQDLLSCVINISGIYLRQGIAFIKAVIAKDFVDFNDALIDLVVTKIKTSYFPRDTEIYQDMLSCIKQYMDFKKLVHEVFNYVCISDNADEVILTKIDEMLTANTNLVNAKINGQTLLHVTFEKHNIELAKVILKHQPDTSLQDNVGHTALQMLQNTTFNDIKDHNIPAVKVDEVMNNLFMDYEIKMSGDHDGY